MRVSSDLIATPDEIERYRGTGPPMVPLVELLGGKSEPASEDEVADLEEWLAERDRERLEQAEEMDRRMRELCS